MHHVLEDLFRYYGYDVFRTRFCINTCQTLLPLVGGAAGYETSERYDM